MIIIEGIKASMYRSSPSFETHDEEVSFTTTTQKETRQSSTPPTQYIEDASLSPIIVPLSTTSDLNAELTGITTLPSSSVARQKPGNDLTTLSEILQKYNDLNREAYENLSTTSELVDYQRRFYDSFYKNENQDTDGYSPFPVCISSGLQSRYPADQYNHMIPQDLCSSYYNYPSFTNETTKTKKHTLNSFPPRNGYPTPVRVNRKSSNVRERTRTHSVNDGFLTLRGLIPTDPPERKLSKIETLRLATSYIWHLNSLLRNSCKSQHTATPTPDNEELYYVTCCQGADRICTFCVSFLKALRKGQILS